MRRALAVALGATLIVGISATAAAAARPSNHGCVWLAGDLHIHTVYSHDAFGGPLYDDEDETQDAYTAGWTVAEEGAIATSRGLDYLAITDHNNVRSQSDPAWETWNANGLLMVPAYENSIGGHAQMLGATKVYDNSVGVPAVATQLRSDGGTFQVNHPADRAWEDSQGNFEYPGFFPDAVEVWNIGAWIYQPPFPATNDHEYPLSFYDAFLDQGGHVAATGGSDSHWRATTALQGPGQPTTWVCAEKMSSSGVVQGVRAGRTTISHQPPAYEGAFAVLEADADGDGTYESNLGDTIPAGARVRASVDLAPGAILRVVTDGSSTVTAVPIDSPRFKHVFEAPESSTWLRAEVYYEDGGEVRSGLGPLCDVVGNITGNFGDEYGDVAYCHNRLAMVAMTSPVYVGSAGVTTP